MPPFLSSLFRAKVMNISILNIFYIANRLQSDFGALKGLKWKLCPYKPSCRSRWSRDMRHKIYSYAETPGLWARILLEVYISEFYSMCVLCVCSGPAAV